jgi:hypothetical protein
LLRSGARKRRLVCRGGKISLVVVNFLCALVLPIEVENDGKNGGVDNNGGDTSTVKVVVH